MPVFSGARTVSAIRAVVGAALQLGQRSGARGRLRALQRRAIGYIGWAGNRNIGDEAVLLAAKTLLPGHQLEPFGGCRKERLLCTLGLGGDRVFRAVLLGGGTLVNAGYLPIVKEAIKQKLPLHMIGTGVGSAGFRAPPNADLNMWRSALPRFGSIGVRGPVSKSRLDDLGARHVEVIGDLALSLTPDQLLPRGNRRRLVVNLAAPRGIQYGGGELAAYRSVAEISREFQSTQGEVVAVALGDHDEYAMHELAREVGVFYQTLVQIRESPFRFFDLVQGCTAVIGVRLHAAVLACCVGVPPILFAYRDKCEDFMRSMGLEDYLVPIRDDGGRAVRAAWARLTADRDVLGAAIYSRALQMREVQRKFASRLSASLYD